MEARFEAPKTPTEAALVDIWERILGLEKASTKVNFFQVGGNSLNMVRLQEEIRKAYGLNVPVRSLYSRNTIVEQAQLIDGFAVSMETPDAVSEELIEEEI